MPRAGPDPYDDDVAKRSAPWTRDEIILAADLVRRNGWHDLRKDHPDVIALSELLRSLPANAEAAQDPRFRSPGSVSRKAADIATAHPDYVGAATKGGAETERVVKAFADNPGQMALIAAATRAEWEAALEQGRDPFDTGVDPDAPETDETGTPEGRVLWSRHLRRERDPGLRRKKIQAILAAHGALACEVCGFDFGQVYGDVGEGYIEVHHVVPLRVTGETNTRLSDLAVLCSNCHRMIHRRTPFITPDELRAHLRRAG